MLGFFSYPSNEITNTSASVVKAMRQSCKNILYTVANSGNYANGDPTGGMDNMTRTFLIADIIIAAVLIGAEAIVLIRYRKKSKQA